MRRQLAVAAFGVVFSVTGLMAAQARADFLPANHLDLEDNLYGFTGLTQTDFNNVIDRLSAVYTPIIEAHGGHLVVNRRWTDPTVNASASQSGTTWTVNMYGGLARRPEVTIDGFTMVMCHELGHHLGGFPFVEDWAANEGQADYFATHACAQQVWGNDAAGNAQARNNIPDEPKRQCDAVWTTTEAQDLCYRTMLASKSLGDLLGALGGETVNFSTPDTSVVDTTDDEHPAAQCRLDTYMAGATCTQTFDKTVIPGKEEDDNNSLDAERDSSRYTCTDQDHFTMGKRPLCWFAPRI